MQRTTKEQGLSTDRSSETTEPVTKGCPLVERAAEALHLRLPLTVDEVIVEYDGPQLFTATDELGRRVLVMSVDEVDGTEVTLAAQLAPMDLQAVLDGSRELRSAFDGTLPAIVQEVSFGKDGSSVRMVDPAQIPEEYLPETGTFLSDEVVQEVEVASAASAAHVPTEGWDGAHSIWLDLH
jgi:hypothetical protein